MGSLLQFFQNQSDLALVTSGAVITMIVVNTVYLLICWLRPTSGLPKVGSRIRFLWGIAAIIVLSAVYTPKILLVYIAFISFLALKEFFSITPTRRADRRVLFWAYLSIPVQFFFIWNNWYQAFIIFVPVHIFLILPMIMVIVGDTNGFLKAWSTLGWGILSTVFTLGYLAYLLFLPNEANLTGEGISLFLFLFLLAQVSHAAQFYFGRRFNHPKLSLTVSTTRNWASLLGSLIVVAPIAWLTAPWLTPFSTLHAIMFGLLIATGGFVGYIILSAIKLDLQLKDRGSMTPGRGGVLNRIDTVIYTAPLFFYIVNQLYY